MVEWLDHAFGSGRRFLDREWTGVNFLGGDHPAIRLWPDFWPQLCGESRRRSYGRCRPRSWGERFYIHACKAKATVPVPIWSDDLRAGTPPAWMIELAEQVKLIEPELLSGAMLRTGLIAPRIISRGDRFQPECL